MFLRWIELYEMRKKLRTHIAYSVSETDHTGTGVTLPGKGLNHKNKTVKSVYIPLTVPESDEYFGGV
jgi:hypothetical protein